MDIFSEISVILVIAAFLALVFRVFKQPIMLAYILAGIVISQFFPIAHNMQATLRELAEVGIALLLFTLGLEIKLSEVPTIGKVALLVALVQALFSSLLGFLLAILLGFSQSSAIYIGTMITFSSTIIAVKLLSDKQDLHSLYGKIAVGILLFQDLFAIVLLIILSSLSGASVNSSSILLTLITMAYKLGTLITLLFFASQYILPKILDFVAKSSETLFIFSLAWVFGLSVLVSSPFIGMSIEIGGFLAGLSLASSVENFQIASRMKTLRDFFVILFFVTLGMQMNLSSVTKVIVPALILSAFVLFGKPLVVTVLLESLGYRKRTALFTAFTTAQISEFSLILAFLGQRLGYINGQVVSLITLVGIITFIFSNYLILSSNTLYHKFHKYLGLFERKGNNKEEIGDCGEMDNHIVLVGAHRMGESIAKALLAMKKELVVVDFNPDVIKLLKKNHIKVLFGDIADIDIQEKARLTKAKLVISTVPDVEDNLLLIKSLNKRNRRAKIVVMGRDKQDEKKLYKAGADYVVLPHLSGGYHIAKLLQGEGIENVNRERANELFLRYS